jgi:cell division protein ZapA
MATVTVEVNGRAYMVGCEDGQESHVEALAKIFDAQVRDVGAQVGQVGELRLFLMAALLTADELADARARLADAEAAD